MAAKSRSRRPAGIGICNKLDVESHCHSNTSTSFEDTKLGSILAEAH